MRTASRFVVARGLTPEIRLLAEQAGIAAKQAAIAAKQAAIAIDTSTAVPNQRTLLRKMTCESGSAHIASWPCITLLAHALALASARSVATTIDTVDAHH